MESQITIDVIHVYLLVYKIKINGNYIHMNIEGIKMENSYKYFKNKDCKYFPCHKGLSDDFNCLFCYCPMYSMPNCPGSKTYIEKNGKKIKVCTDCTFPHRPENYDKIIQILIRNNNN